MNKKMGAELHPWCESVLARVHIDAGGQYYVSNCEVDSSLKVIVSSTDSQCIKLTISFLKLISCAVLTVLLGEKHAWALPQTSAAHCFQ
ncbi:hypothetical protein QR685DRAFT_567589 [Neurospora intermedia]|uniref:Uncharacterized protein n=1 Tax=Neurospora intermedia TaxID=5142 RepID=A0ABR3DPU6_NEUIN